MADTFDLKSNGTVLFEWDGRDEGVVHRRTLRRPSLTEYSSLVDLLSELAEAIDGDRPGSGLAATRRWIEAVFSSLGDTPLPDGDDQPAWLIAGDISTALIQHWQARPGRGV